MKRSQKAGLPPGTLKYIGRKNDSKVKISVIEYSETSCISKEISLQECISIRKNDSKVWVNIDGVHDEKTLKEIGECYKIHPYKNLFERCL